MGWNSAVHRPARAVSNACPPPPAAPVTEQVNWDRLVALDFETFWDADYTLSKLSTSEYVRDPRFEAQMVGLKIGASATRVVCGPDIAAELRRIDWRTHSLLCHHAQFDGFILDHWYGIRPSRVYCTLSMARGLHSNDIGAGLDEVAKFYGGKGKTAGALEAMRGLRYVDLLLDHPDVLARGAAYCANDVDEMVRIFTAMLPAMPKSEMDLIDITCRMFTEPVLRVDLPSVAEELDREVLAREELLLSLHGPDLPPPKGTKAAVAAMSPRQQRLEMVRAALASNDAFVRLLRAEGVEPPHKVSPAYLKHRIEAKKYAWAFARTDLEFTALAEHPNPRVRALVEGRLTVKSTLGETRAARFLEAGRDGMPLPVYLKFYGAHTGRWSAGNRMNLQNLPRGGALRRAILAPPGHSIIVADSGQIEARVNAWLWRQEDLLEDFAAGDRGIDRDVYCKFADLVYGRAITTADKQERQVGKIATLGLGYGMGAPKFQNTLAIGAMGPPVIFDADVCQSIVQTYRRKNERIVEGWRICSRIIQDMATGRAGAHGPLEWSREVVRLPNGMFLKYPRLRRSLNEEGREEWVYTRKGEDARIYGGLLTENLVQALARIIVSDQLLAISKRYRVVMTTHDEIAAIAPQEQAAAAYEFMLQQMRTPPAWCADIPLNADGGYDTFYCK